MNLFDFLRERLRELFGPPPTPDPRAQLRELLDHLHGELREAKIRAASMIREEKRVATERDEYLFRAQQAEQAASDALQSGREEIARRILERKLHEQQTARQLEEQRAALGVQVDALREAIETYKLEIERVEREQRTWEMRERTARLKSNVHPDVPSTALSEARSLLQASQEAAMREEARAEVRDRVGRDPVTQGRQMRQNPEIEQELERLRSRLQTPPTE